MYHLIRKEYFSLRHPLHICEVGVGSGAMLSFVRAGDALSEHGALPGYINGWDSVSRNIDESRLAALGYSHCLKKNIEESDVMLPRQYDIMILLHILEHLYEPERVFAKLLPFLREGGLVIGGFPGLPELFRRSREQCIRKTAQSFGHVSVFSPRRVVMMAKQNSLHLEMLTGAYLFRSTGFLLERYTWWSRLNLLFGAMFPAWPGEIYWAMRKPATINP